MKAKINKNKTLEWNRKSNEYIIWVFMGESDLFLLNIITLEKLFKKGQTKLSSKLCLCNVGTPFGVERLNDILLLQLNIFV